MKPITVSEISTESDFDEFAEWVSYNTTESSKVGYESMLILKAFNGKNIQFAMVHPVAVIEHLATNPESSVFEQIRSLKAIEDAIENLSRASGIREIWCQFGFSDDALERVAIHYGFEKVNLSVWRKKI